VLNAFHTLKYFLPTESDEVVVTLFSPYSDEEIETD
jgi:hypothetical protein